MIIKRHWLIIKRHWLIIKRHWLIIKRSYIENKYKETITKNQIDKIMNDKDNKYWVYEELQILTYLEAIYNIVIIFGYPKIIMILYN